MKAHTPDGAEVTVAGRKAEALWAVRRLEREWRAGRTSTGRRRAAYRGATTRQVAREVDRSGGVPWPGDAAWKAGSDEQRERWTDERTTTKAIYRPLTQLEALGVVKREDGGWIVAEASQADEGRASSVTPRSGVRKWYRYGGANHETES